MNRRSITIILTLLLVSSFVYAQTPPPGGGSAVGAPIDGFSTALLLAGAAFGVKRFKDEK